MLKIINSRILKIIAMLSMLIDHIGYLFFPETLWFRIVGRLAMPIFCFLIAFGAIKTKNNVVYFLRLFICAIVYQFVFNFVSTGSLFIFEYLNVFFTLSIGSLTIMLMKKYNKVWLQGIFVTLILALLIAIKQYVVIDYGIAGYLLIICLYVSLNFSLTVTKISAVFPLVAFNLILYAEYPWAVQWYSMLVLILIILFNDKHIKISKIEKYAFYAFYPLHMMILYGIAILLEIGLGM